jgi:hypothetical protein
MRGGMVRSTSALSVNRDRLPSEWSFQVRIREAKTTDGFLERLTATQLVQEPHPAQRRPFGHDIDGKKTLVVCHLRGGRAQSSEPSRRSHRPVCRLASRSSALRLRDNGSRHGACVRDDNRLA